MIPITEKTFKIPLIVFILFLVSTFIAWKFTQNVVKAEAKRDFNQEVQVVKHWMQDRLNLYLPIALSIRIFFESSDSITINEWSAYIKRLKLIDKYPGISSISYIERVSDQNKAVFITHLESGYTIHPQEKKEEYYFVKYVEPLSENKATIGLDLSSDPKQLELLNNIRDEDPTSTGRVTLITSPKKGFEIILPVYRKGPSPMTVKERREALKGFVRVGFAGDRLFQDIFNIVDSTNLTYKVYSNLPSQENLLFDQDPDYSDSILNYQQGMTTRDSFEFNGQTWYIVAMTKPDFKLIPSQVRLPLVVLTSGLVLSFVFLGIYLYLLKLNRIY